MVAMTSNSVRLGAEYDYIMAWVMGIDIGKPFDKSIIIDIDT